MGKGGRLADRGPRAAAGEGHKIRKKKVNVLRHVRVRLLLPWGLVRRHHGCGAAVLAGQGRLGLDRPAGGRRRSGGRERTRLMLTDIEPV